MTNYFIPTSEGKYIQVDKEDYKRFGSKLWCLDGKGYAIRNTGKKNKRLHCLITGFDNTDHIDRNKLNCRRSNLRECTHRQNVLNTSPINGMTSIFKGVHKFSGTDKYTSQFSGVHLGLFYDELDAAKAYDKACLLDKDSEFCFINFPNGKMNSYFIDGEPVNDQPGNKDKISQPFRGKSRFKGVTKSGNKWIARKTVNGYRVYLGIYNSELLAHEAVKSI